jgi:hypothetical protein
MQLAKQTEFFALTPRPPLPQAGEGETSYRILKYSLSRFSGEGGPQGRVRVKKLENRIISVNDELFSAKCFLSLAYCITE